MKILNQSLIIAFIFGLASNAYPSNIHWGKQTKEKHPGLHSFFSAGTHNAKEVGRAIENIIEPEEDVETDGLDFGYHSIQLITLPHHVLLDKILSALPPLFYLNRSTVPLFVLHHSWKNFPH